MKDSYYNMREIMEQHMHLIDNAKAAMEELGIEPKVSPIRGGTDGARLSSWDCPVRTCAPAEKIITADMSMPVYNPWKNDRTIDRHCSKIRRQIIDTDI